MACQEGRLTSALVGTDSSPPTLQTNFGDGLQASIRSVSPGIQGPIRDRFAGTDRIETAHLLHHAVTACCPRIQGLRCLYEPHIHSATCCTEVLGERALARSYAALAAQAGPGDFHVIIVVLLVLRLLVSSPKLGLCPCPAFARRRRGNSNRCDNPDSSGLSELESELPVVCLSVRYGPFQSATVEGNLPCPDKTSRHKFPGIVLHT